MPQVILRIPMQEKLTPSLHIGPDTKSIERIWFDIQTDGKIQESTELLIRDEEKTHAAEILALISKRGTIPREYALQNNDLVDTHGASLRSVLDGGITHAEHMVEDGVLGGGWELARRRIESDTFDAILSMSSGEACIEWSPTDLSKPEDERRAQGYAGDTLVRLTHRVSQEKFLQFNIVVPCSDLNMLSKVRRKVTGERKSFDAAEQMLAEPQFVMLGGMDTATFVRRLEGYVDIALLGSNPGLSVIRMLKRFREKKHDAWQFVNAKDQQDIFQSLSGSLRDASELPAGQWQNAAALARGGAWQILIERYNGKKVSAKETGDISSGAKRAAAAGAVFTACGGSVDMKTILGRSDGPAIGFFERLLTTGVLLVQECGFGSCLACSMTGTLFGCGVFCRDCNKVWCETYAQTGEQLEAEDILRNKYLAFARA